MSNLLLRILLWFVAIPLLFVLVYFFPQPHHLVFNLLTVPASSLAAVEVSQLFSRNGGNKPHLLSVILIGALLPALAILELFGLIGIEVTLAAIVTVAGLNLAAQVFRRNEMQFGLILPAVSANTTVLIYPGLFMSYVVRLSSLPDATFLLFSYVCAVYFNDTMAYIAGRLFGKSSRGLVAISPNKSVPGFVGGFLLSPIVVVVAHALRPTLFPGTTAARLLFGGIIGIVVILGDLVESAMKRSATTKDSGQIIPGRGGILDSIDSPIFTAPVFYYLYKVFFHT